MDLQLNPEKTFAIVADDLTGANDTGIQFLKKGLKTLVILDLEIEPGLINDIQVVVLNTDSRFLAPEQAYAQTRAMGLVLKNLKISRVYKKIDSTLRGHIGTEIDALMEILNFKVCFLTPAFPVYGRTVQNGSLYLDGVPIHKTAIASDPTFYMKNAFIPDLLVRQTRRKVEVIPLETLRQGKETLLPNVHRLIQDGTEIFVLDALVQDDLKIAAQTIARLSMPVLICGSAGLAAEIPEAFHLEGTAGKEKKNGRRKDEEKERSFFLPFSDSPPRFSVVGICGSLSPVTREQVEYAARNLQIPVLEALSDKMVDEQEKTGEIQRLVTRALSYLIQGKDILVTTDNSRKELPSEVFLRHSRQVAQALGDLAVELLNSTRCKVQEMGQISGLFLTGGDIALSVCQHLGARGIYLVEEVLPGIPSGRLIGGDSAGLNIITKAGAFGHPEAIARCIEYLKTRHQDTGFRGQKENLPNSDS
ncbi:MAG TPA: four-carbon acid sugar kinase family protein [Candidatus Limnocylindrales bacterium]|nr:four-carbon acid sugar kinase family protein [Candidatus Limnocylindrales bacterium]